MTSSPDTLVDPPTGVDDEWTKIGPSIEPGGVMAARVPGRAVVVWRTASGRLLAFDDSCPHQGNSLSDGAVIGETLRCATHGWEVATDGWCVRAAAATRRHDVLVQSGQMYVRLVR